MSVTNMALHKPLCTSV